MPSCPEVLKNECSKFEFEKKTIKQEYDYLVRKSIDEKLCREHNEKQSDGRSCM